jgi:hypothetical protein
MTHAILDPGHNFVFIAAEIFEFVVLLQPVGGKMGNDRAKDQPGFN